MSDLSEYTSILFEYDEEKTLNGRLETGLRIGRAEARDEGLAEVRAEERLIEYDEEKTLNGLD